MKEKVRRKEGLNLKMSKNSPHRGKELIKHMAGTATIKLKTDDIMKLTRGDD